MRGSPFPSHRRHRAPHHAGEAVLEMRKHLEDGTEHPPEAFVFGNEIGEAITAANLRRRWTTCCKRAKVTGLTFHDLRRELASRLRESGAPDHVVAAWLGHANISTTSRYLKTSRAGLQKYVAAFERHRDEICTNVAQTTENPSQEASREASKNRSNLLN